MQNPLSQPEIWSTVAIDYTSDLVPVFRRFALDAIEMAELPADADLLDVAAGPGTLSLEVAPRARSVVAVDFAEGMVEMLRQRIRESGMANIEAVQGDGMALPFADRSFDAAFSMFGLIFFPDRAAGLREMRRVLRPDGRAVVSSWPPVDEVPVLVSMLGAIAELLPDMPASRATPPLSDEKSIREELEAAGFRDVAVKKIGQHMEVPSVEAFWESQKRSSVMCVLLRNRLDAAEWERVEKGVIERMRADLGTGTIEGEWPAWLGMGRVG